jgi:hypothetical protein
LTKPGGPGEVDADNYFAVRWRPASSRRRQQALESNGFRALEALTAGEAVRLLGELHPDLALVSTELERDGF